jgi:formylglycine-generating enzyme required for sulfatase activity
MEKLLQASCETGLVPHLREAAASALDVLGWQPTDLDQFIHIRAGKDHAAFWIGKYPVTNAQYERFLQAEDFGDERWWQGFPKFDENCVRKGDWGDAGLKWFETHAELNEMTARKIVYPRYWSDPSSGIARRSLPVVSITWYEANAYCRWLKEHWQDKNLQFSSTNPEVLPPAEIRLPTEREWERAAGGMIPSERFPWDLNGWATEELEEILQQANVKESQIGRTTPVWMYPLGASPAGVWDMAGNVWEWQANFREKENKFLALRGGSWDADGRNARLSHRYGCRPEDWVDLIGFRVVVPS